ncbi:MAG: hypothetical protein ACC700_18120, partial [Anaerolineales bacterium]
TSSVRLSCSASREGPGSMSLIIDNDPNGLPIIDIIVQSINPDADVGIASGRYSGRMSKLVSLAESIATAKIGVLVSIYDPELAAAMTGEL